MKISLFIVGLLISVSVFSQEKNQDFATEKKSEFKKSSKVQTSMETQIYSNPAVDNKDGYMGMKDQILKRLTVNSIPSDFPKYNNGSVEGYKIEIKNWMKQNKDLLTDEFKQKYKARKAQK